MAVLGNPSPPEAPTLDHVIDVICAMINREKAEPLWLQLAAALRMAVDNGDLPNGTHLANEIDLARRLGVSRPTVRRALSDLTESGLLVRRRGAGSRIVHPEEDDPRIQVDLDAPIRSTGELRTELISIEVRVAEPPTAAALHVAEGSAVTQIRRVRCAGDQPIVVMTDFLPQWISPITAEELLPGDIMETLRAKGIRVHIAEHQVAARTATLLELGLLGERPGAVVMVVRRTAYDEAGSPVAYGKHLYSGRRHSFAWRQLTTRLTDTVLLPR